MRQRFVRGFVFFAFGASGAIALALEVAWTRALATVMGSSTYALSTLLAAFMAGLSVGGAAGAALSRRVRDPAAAFGACELGIGAAGLLVVPVVRSLTPVYVWAYYAFHQSFAAFSAAQFLIAFLVMGIPTTLMGASFPLLVRAFSDWRGEPGHQSGRLYAVNTLGGIAGALGAGFLAIPALGVAGTAAAAAGLAIANGLAVLALSGRARAAGAGAALAVAAIACASAFDPPRVPAFGFEWAHRFGSEALARRVADGARDAEVLFEHHGVEGDVWVLRSRLPGRQAYTLVNGSKLEAGEDVAFALLAQLPYLTRAEIAPPRTALSIGLGSGRSLRALAESPIDAITSVELSDGVLEANRRVLSPELFGDPRIRHERADGRNFLLVRDDRWDVLVVSPSWAVELASAGLLTDQFFGLAASRLSPDGVIGVWVDFSMMSDAEMRRLLRTFARSFRHVSGWGVPGGDVVLVGSNAARYPDERAVVARLGEVLPDGAAGVRAMLTDATPKPARFEDLNTDDRPFIEFSNAERLLTGPG